MESPLGSPTRHTVTVPAQSQGEQRGPPKQFVGLSKLHADEKSFRYLDFAEGGTNAALNKWGQFLQFSRLVVGGSCPDSWNYVSLEPRNIFRLDYTHGNSLTQRHDTFDRLCMENQGLGLRFSHDTNLSEPEHYYRNDRWPEVRYTAEEKVKVVIQHYIRDGEIIQDMYLTSESDEETELSLEFEFATGIRIAIGDMNRPKGREEDAPDHLLEPVPEGEAPGFHWNIWRGNYCATASLFEDGEPKSFSLVGGHEKNNMTKFGIGILSDDPLIHRETFKLEPKARVKFTSIFKLDRGKVPNTPPQYFDISRLVSFSDRWWSFKTESSSFIFRRNLETILSHAMPLPWVSGETYRPYVLHNHDLVDTCQTWSSSLDQAFYLLEIDKVLQQQNTADQATKSDYRERIRRVIFGFFVWILRHAERNGFPETVILSLSGKCVPLAKKDETGELVVEEKIEEDGDILKGPWQKSPEPGVVEPAEQIVTPITKVSSMGNKMGSPVSRETTESTSGLRKASTSHPEKPEESVDPPPVRPFEPELSKYADKFQNCCRFLVLLDMCSTNYPGEKSLITRMVDAFLKLSWEPIEMSKHRESHLWPDRLDILEGSPSPYARFRDWGDYENCGYGGQGTYVYAITTQVLVWRAVRSANELLKLISADKSWDKWMAHQSLSSKAIRDRTLEAFRPLGTERSQKTFPDRFVSKIKGHAREFCLDQRSYCLLIPSFVEDFFFDGNNKPMFAWTETLRYYGESIDSIGSQTLNTWESFIHYQLSADGGRHQELRKSLEAGAYPVGLFSSSSLTPSCHCPHTTSWAMVTDFLSADHTKKLYPQFRISRGCYTRAGRARRSMPPQEGLMGVGTNPDASISSSVRQEGGKSRREGKGLDITSEGSHQVDDQPLYGEWYWFRDPLFMKHKPKKLEMNKGYIETFLGLGDSDNWCDFWETSEGKDRFLRNIANMSSYDWGNERNALIKPGVGGWFDRSHGREALLKLQQERVREVDQKRIIIMRDCMIEHLIALMAIIDFQEASHTSEFLARLRLMYSYKMAFEEQTIMPDNLWITEFNINFITAPFRADVESAPHPNYFPRRRERFLSMNDVAPARIMAEAAMGFRIIGDLHGRYWTCYVFYDFGGEELRSDARTKVKESGYGKSSSQRKCLEGFLVCQALDLVLSETKAILDTINESMEEDKKSQQIFNLLLTEDDLRGENYFKTMKKNSLLYPWLLGVYGGLRGKCIESCSVAEQWISAEDTREYRPRWSEKDQRSFGDEVAKYQRDVKICCIKLGKIAKDLKERIETIETQKESLSNELSLREARTSTQLAYTVNIFAIVTTIYLPLTFSATIVAIQDFHWQSPTKALIRITLAVSFGTVILLTNVTLLRRGLAALKTRVYRSIRLRMVRASESSRASEYTTSSPASNHPQGSGKEFVYREKRPAWTYWDKRANRFYDAEQRILLMASVTSGRESYWWYWYFMAIFIIIVAPVQELTFIIRTLRLQKIENAGPLKKLVRLPWAPIWILQLVLVYLIMLAGYAVLYLLGFSHRAAVWLWTGNDIAEVESAPPKRVEKSLFSESEGDEVGLGSEPGSTQKGRGLIGWLKKPAKTMHFYIIKEALQPREKKKGFDEEKYEATAEVLEVLSST